MQQKISAKDMTSEKFEIYLGEARKYNLILDEEQDDLDKICQCMPLSLQNIYQTNLVKSMTLIHKLHFAYFAMKKYKHIF